MATNRTDRDLARGRRAAARSRYHGGSALAAAHAHIEASFSLATHRSVFKDRVATVIRLGAAHPAVRHRYRILVARRPFATLDAAIVAVERMRCAELEARAAAAGSWGYCGRSRLALVLLDEIRVVLRMLRRYAPARFAGLAAEVLAGRCGGDGRC